ncbi:MAG: hypothetical protein NTW33_11695 [Methanoregula sp.]|nr:hypothetical protein [Methanoregula sp.]
MDGLRFTIKERAFPSHGRVRLHESRLTELKIINGDPVDLINETSKKTVTVTVIADRMVDAGEIRVSAEDLQTLGLKDGSEVTVRKTPPLGEKVKKAADDANKSFSQGVKKLDGQFRKSAGDVKTGAAKTGETATATVKKAADSMGRIAGETSERVKKGLKGKDEL